MTYRVIQGDCLEKLRELPDETFQTCITSPPYWGLRDYGAEGQIGLEPTPEEYASRLADVFDEVRRVLRPDGTLWLNIGDTYCSTGGRTSHGAGSQRKGRSNLQEQNRVKGAKRSGDLKHKDLVGTPWMVAFELRRRGWWLRQEIVWHKPNPMPESVVDRCTAAHEKVFLLAKSPDYFFDIEANREPAQSPAGQVKRFGGNKWPEGDYEGTPQHRHGHEQWNRIITTSDTRNRRNVWTMPTGNYREAHFATYPVELAEHCLLPSTEVGDQVLDPFSGAATTGVACIKHRRSYTGIELNGEYLRMSERRLHHARLEFPPTLFETE